MIIFLGGRADRREFLELARDAREIAARCGASLIERDGFKAADETLRRVDFFLLLRSFPNEFCVKDVERLRRASPLAPIATIVGKLCESENRTGERFPGVRRYYAHEWRETFRSEFLRFFDFRGASGVFAESPLTSEVELRASKELEHVHIGVCRGERTLILSDDATSASFLANLFRSHGSTTRVCSLERFATDELSGFMPTRVVFDSARFIDAWFTVRVQTARERYPSARIELLTFSPTESETEYFEDIQRWGHTRVLAKPFNVASLLGSRG